MEPNVEQVKGQLRTYIAAFGGIIAGWFAHSGYVTADQVLGILNSPAFLGAATIVVSAVWSLLVHKQSNAVAVVTAMGADPANPVKGVVIEQTVAGRQLMDTVSSPLAVPAGSAAAATMAKTEGVKNAN